MKKRSKSLLSRLNIERISVYLYRLLIIALPIAALVSVSLIGGDVAYNRVNAATDSTVIDYSRLDRSGTIVDYSRTDSDDNYVTDLVRINMVNDALSALERTDAVNEAVADLTRTNADNGVEAGLTDAVTNAEISLTR
ncbi:MAG: hypothetical protein ACTSQF_09470 [Candidatus Heimdallarchaeaceae archaeon]